jgi:hypothetical protein
VVLITSGLTAELQRSLLRVSRASGAGRFVIIAVGERPELFPDVRRKFAVYHLGGEEKWDAIEHIQLTRIA